MSTSLIDVLKEYDDMKEKIENEIETCKLIKLSICLSVSSYCLKCR